MVDCECCEGVADATCGCSTIFGDMYDEDGVEKKPCEDVCVEVIDCIFCKPPDSDAAVLFIMLVSGVYDVGGTVGIY